MNREEYLRIKGKLVDTGKTHDELEIGFYRASGLCVCNVCNKLYYDHPYANEARDQEGAPYLNVLCDGDIVKL